MLVSDAGIATMVAAVHLYVAKTCFIYICFPVSLNFSRSFKLNFLSRFSPKDAFTSRVFIHMLFECYEGF